MPRVDFPGWARDSAESIITGERNGEVFHRLLSDPGGLTQFGAFIERLPPGSRSGAAHRHEDEDEMIFVLSGEVTLVEDHEATVLTAGCAAAWPAGGFVHHTLENHSENDASYLVIGTRSKADRVHFQDHDLILDLQRDIGGQISRTKTRRDGTSLD